MILVCPNCETQYFAEDSAIASSGRSVKCAACGHAWFFRSEQPGAHKIYQARVQARRRDQGKRAAAIVWIMMAASLAAGLASLVFLRGAVVEYWPRAASAYAVFGMSVNRFGLEFDDTQAERFFDGTTPVLEIRGALRNVRSKTIVAPEIRVVLLDDTGREITRTRTQITPVLVPPGARAVFSARIANPPFQSFELELSLVPGDMTPTTTKNGS